MYKYIFHSIIIWISWQKLKIIKESNFGEVLIYGNDKGQINMRFLPSLDLFLNRNVNEIKRNYTINSYRVLLTRARRGMVIFVPEGDAEDETRKTEFYDGTYEYLKSIGIEELK